VGKTHVQKALSLLASVRPGLVPFRYVLYKHGPYSFEVEDEIEQMRSYTAIEVEPAGDGYGVILHPGEMASYVTAKAPLSQEARDVVEEVCEFVGAKNVHELEKLATAGWIRVRERIEEHEAVANRLHALKPHIAISDARAADLAVATLLAGK
jgi:hypothetical protein